MSLFVARGLASHLRLKRQVDVVAVTHGWRRQGAGISSEIETRLTDVGSVEVFSRQGAGISSEIETGTLALS